MVPAAGQGILAIEARLHDERVLSLVRVLDDGTARRAVLAERALLATLGGGCQVPIAAYATEHDGMLTLTGLVARPDGSVVVRAVRQGGSDQPEALGRALGAEILACGGRRVLLDIGLGANIGGSGTHLEATSVVVARDESPDDSISQALLAAGAHVLPLRLMQVCAPKDGAPLEKSLRNLGDYDVVAFTSPHAVEHALHRLTEAGLDLRALRADALVASVGKATSRALEAHGVRVDVEGDAGAAVLAHAIGAALPLKGRRVLVPRSEDGREELVDALTAAGAQVSVVDAYRSEPKGDGVSAARAALEALSHAQRRFVVVTSPRRAEILLASLDDAARGHLKSAHVLAIGATTGAALHDRGLEVRVVDKPTPEAVLAAVRA
jgi:uroporphyrinogen-III synthase